MTPHNGVTVELREARSCHYECLRMSGVKPFQYQSSLQLSPFFHLLTTVIRPYCVL